MKIKSLCFLSLLSLPAHAQYVGNGNKILTDDLYYSPTAPVVALFNQKQELALSAFGLTSNGVSVAYSVTSHINVWLNYGHSRRDDHRLNNFEGGIGYFSYFGRKRQWIYELSGQAVLGKSRMQLDAADLRENISYNKYSVQAVFGFRHRIIEAAITPRFGTIKFHSFEKLYEGEPHPWLYGAYLDGRSYTILETNLMVRVGSPKVKFGTQLGIPAVFTKQTSELNFYDRFNLIFSMMFRLGLAKEKDSEIR